MSVERAVLWTTLLGAVVAGAMRFGSVESDVKHTQEELTQTRQHVSNVDGRVATLKDDLGGSIHALTTSVAVLTAEVRNLSTQLEKREKQR